jgi:hypothetical protein
MEEIIGKVLLFNKETAGPVWSPNEDYTNTFLKSLEAYFNELLRYRGYISYETILNNLGIEPDLDELETTRILRNNGKGFHFVLTKLDSDTLAYEIKICEGRKDS